MKFIELLNFHNTLCINKKCPLACGFCEIWKNNQEFNFIKSAKEVSVLQNINIQEKLNLIDLIRANQLFEVFKLKRKINLIGGEPFLAENLEYILTYLKSFGINITVWTNLVLPIDNFLKILKLIDTLMIYIPDITDIGYKNISGYGYLEQVKDNINILIDLGINFKIHTKVLSENIINLPILYEYCWERNINLCLHYSKNELFTKEELLYIKRFKKIKKVEVIITNKNFKMSCNAIY